MKRYRIIVDGKTYEVEIEDTRSRRMKVRVDGEAFEIEVASEADEPPPASHASPAVRAPAAGPPMNGYHWLDAPLPGTVVHVVAQAGQRVEPGDELLTIEAMKMLNVIRSPRAGTIAEVHVGEGKHVNHGDILITFK